MGCDNEHGRVGRTGGTLSAGRGRQGRGRGGSTTPKHTPKHEEMRFAPHGGPTNNKLPQTFDTVKEHLISFIQKTYKFSQDVVISLRDMKLVNLDPELPKLKLVPADESISDDQRQLQQDGIKIQFQIDYQAYLERKVALENNMVKAYALIFSTYCNKTMQTRVENHHLFQTDIQDNPIKLLEVVQVLMHDGIRERFHFASVTEALRNLFFIKQHEQESVLDYSKRFKEARDVLRSYIGDEIFHYFIERTSEYRDEDDEDKQQSMKDDSFAVWSAYLLLKNADQAKFGNLVNNMQTQYAMGNNQYPKNISKAVDIMSNYKVNNAKDWRKINKDKEKKKNNPPETKHETSFAQGSGKDCICYCCGKKGHISPDCPDKDKRKGDWHVKKSLQLYEQQENEVGQPQTPPASILKTPTTSSTSDPSATK